MAFYTLDAFFSLGIADWEKISFLPLHTAKKKAFSFFRMKNFFFLVELLHEELTINQVCLRQPGKWLRFTWGGNFLIIFWYFFLIWSAGAEERKRLNKLVKRALSVLWLKSHS